MEFPNDLLWELDRMEFYIPETGETVRTKKRPIVIITSNAEKELPDAFLRRCIFHYIAFPDPDMMRQIIHAHDPNLEETLVNAAIKAFYDLRKLSGLSKKPGTSELLDWVRALVIGGIDAETLSEEIPLSAYFLKRRKIETRGVLICLRIFSICFGPMGCLWALSSGRPHGWTSLGP